ncbi:MAG: radical SAM protein [Nitrospirae bacterium]|nr:radical SAM protein [Nitrospirota bacterium]
MFLKKIAERITGKVSERITGKANENIAGKVAGKITENIAAKVSSNITENVTERLYPDRCRDRVIGLPDEIVLETTNKCNLRCTMCHVHSEDLTKNRPEGFMAEGLWKKIIDEISGWDKTVNLYTFGAGETLLYPRFSEIIGYAARFPNITTGFLTNGMLLSRARARELIDLNIGWIGISLDGTDAAFVEKYRKGAKLGVIEDNIRSLVEERGSAKKPCLRINMTLIPGGEEQLGGFLSKWLPLVDEVMTSKYRPLGERTFLDVKMSRTPCHILNKMMVVGWDGRVGLCCEDNFIEHEMGNVVNSGLEDIWYGNGFQSVRTLHQEGLFHKIGLCKECDVWSTNSQVNQYVSDEGYIVKTYTNQNVYTIGG